MERWEDGEKGRKRDSDDAASLPLAHFPPRSLALWSDVFFICDHLCHLWSEFHLRRWPFGQLLNSGGLPEASIQQPAPWEP